MLSRYTLKPLSRCLRSQWYRGVISSRSAVSVLPNGQLASQVPQDFTKSYMNEDKRSRLAFGISSMESIWLNRTKLNKKVEDELTNEQTDLTEKKEINKENREKNKKDIEKKEETEIEKNSKDESLALSGESKNASSSSSAAGGSSSGGDGGDGGNNPKNDGLKKKKEAVSTSTTIPWVYPQVIALPVSRRPLLPGFHKALMISDPSVIKAVKEMMNKGQNYVACFLFKNKDVRADVINSADEVYPIGVFGQITDYQLSSNNKDKVEIMTIVIYPHERIRIDKLIAPKSEEEIEQNKTQRVKVLEAEAIKELEQEGKHFVELPPTEGTEKDGKGIAKTDEKKRLGVEEQNKQFLKEKELRILQKMDDEEAENPSVFLKNHSVSLVEMSELKDEPFDKKSPVITALTSEILRALKEITDLNTMFREQLSSFSASMQTTTCNVFETPAKLADFAAAVSAGDEKELQEILSCSNIEQRLRKSLVVLKKELMTAELQKKISKDIDVKIQKRQREYYLMEQLKGIKRELGIDDERSKLIETFKKRVEKLTLPENVEKIFNDELAKLSTLETAMSEFSVVRNYLDWLTQIPWGIKSKERYNISMALRILDEDHYGMKDVKDRILEFIAVGKLLGKVDGKILCFVGPPGVGKTSIAKSIARSLDRKYFRFSVGGMTDVSEIKGHRRTYVGALPGRIVQGLKKAQTENPLILIDEIDKIGFTSVHGDPSAALLELLDPEQNNSFLDNYLDVPIDMSKVLFVCTANTLDTIPRPLLDRMEVIELSGYVADEKVKIAEKYLIPQAKEKSGLKEANVDITNEGIATLIKQYCRESGVRNLKKQIEKVYRKAALKIATTLDKNVVGTEEDKKLMESIKGNNDDAEQNAVIKADKPSTSPAENEESSGLKETAVEEDKTKVAEDGVSINDQVEIPKDLQITIKPEDLKDYIGPAIFKSDRLYETTIPGVVMGLAWTSMGGTALYIESVLNQSMNEHSHAHLEITGQLGDVMKESSTIAYSFAKMFLAKNYPENRFFERASIHLHCPEGAIPKDGPSAGVTMSSSLLSLALNQPLLPTVAMTGEMTLTGKVLKIGGLKEKTIAAKRSGAKTVIFPKDNLPDWIELSENIKEGLEFVAAEWYDEIFAKLFPGLDTKTGNDVWKAEYKKIDEKEKKSK